MTRQNPDILCKACREFDQSFENVMDRCDFLVTCDHDEFEAKKSPYDPSSWMPIPEVPKYEILIEEWGRSLRCLTSDGRIVNMAEELNRINRSNSTL